MYHLAEGLVRAGVDVQVLTTDLMRDTPFTRFATTPPHCDFPVARVRAWKFLDAPHGLGIVAPAMFRRTMASGADVVHAHGYGYFPTFAASFGTALDGAALVVTPHSDAGRPTWAKRLFDGLVPSLTLKRAHRVISVSQHEAYHLRRLGVRADKIRVVPNGVNLSEFAGLAEARRPADSVTGLFVGRIDPDQKGLVTLVRSIALLPHAVPIQIRLVGEDWGGTVLLKALAERLGISNRIVFVGKLERRALISEYAKADFLVLPSLFEPFGIVLLEAMAAGLPVIASNVGGIPEVVADGDSGVLVEPGNPGALADAILRLCQDERRRREMGRDGKVRASRYAWESVTPQIHAVYQQALEERRS